MALRLGSAILLAFAIGTARLALAQPSASVPVGTASISGRVIDRATKRPVVQVMVRLQRADGRPGELVAATDETGRYHFEAIAAGHYRVSATHPEYASQTFGAPEGMVLTLSREDVIQLDYDEHRTNIEFALARGGTLSGRVTSNSGQPLEGATVRAMLRRADDAFSFDEGVRTNARGEFLISKLPEGRYDVSATWVEPSAPRSSAPRPVYHLSASRRQDSMPVSVTAGALTRNVNIAFPPSELLRIAGQVVRSGAEGHVEAFLMSDASAPVRRLDVDSDGRFTTPRIAAGRYTLVARALAGDEWEAAWMSVDLLFEMNDVTLALLPTGSIAGKVVTDDGSAIPDALQIAAVLADGEREIDQDRRDRADIGPGGVFELRGLCGQRLIRAVGATEGCKVDRVIANKVQVTSFDVQPGNRLEDVLVVLACR